MDGSLAGCRADPRVFLFLVVKAAKPINISLSLIASATKAICIQKSKLKHIRLGVFAGGAAYPAFTPSCFGRRRITRRFVAEQNPYKRFGQKGRLRFGTKTISGHARIHSILPWHEWRLPYPLWSSCPTNKRKKLRRSSHMRTLRGGELSIMIIASATRGSDGGVSQSTRAQRRRNEVEAELTATSEAFNASDTRRASNRTCRRQGHEVTVVERTAAEEEI
ncbi:hypothetical protein FNV43_RR10886 [Rhamnella rubrinervis]|uniref:Uncharacterized protein n=1 Tax=Rhamnella rubrinervis TaxID=2594499 RepID=A0A8K0H575_9ROSA|nr:hypothetical protein FNV43_RR10886 [Rhamnella rubrinervis]